MPSRPLPPCGCISTDVDETDSSECLFNESVAILRAILLESAWHNEGALKTAADFLETLDADH